MLVVPSLIFVVFQAERAITLLFGARYAPSADVLLWLAWPAMIARAYGGGASSTVMSAGGMVPLVVRQYVIGGITSIVLCYVGLLLTANDALRATYAVSLALGTGAIVVSGLGFRVVRRTYGVRFPSVYTLKIAVGALLAGASTLWLPLTESWAQTRMALQLATVLGLAAQYTAVFYVLMRIMKPLSAEDYEVASKASRRVTRFIRPLVGERLPETPAADRR
jgi:O-antigen/teichoic acid export membrane protein